MATNEVVAAVTSGDVAFRAIGPTELKGVAEPVELHRAIRVEP